MTLRSKKTKNDDEVDGTGGNDTEEAINIEITQKYPSVFMNRGFIGAYETLESLLNNKKISDKDYEKVLSAMKNAYKGSLTENDKKYIKKKYSVSI